MKLEIGSTIYTGFIEAQVRTSMDTLFDEFRFVSTNRWATPKPFVLGDDCRILTPDDEQLLDGFINGLIVPIGGDIVISGHDKAYDLLQSTVAGTGEFKNLTVKETIAKICAPFGIAVSGDAPASVDVFRYALNEKAIDVIRDLIGRYGLLINSDGSGNLELTTATTTQRATLQLVEGNNINSGSMIVTENGFSDLSIIGQNRNSTVSGTAIGTANRYRPNTIINGGNLTQGQASTNASWIANIAQPESYSVTVSGLYNERPNTLIDIEAQTWGLSGSLLIRSILWGMTKAEGHFTTFDLVNPAMYGGAGVSSGWV